VLNEYVFVPSNVIQDKGELTINSSATLAVFLSDALNSLMAYPYGSSEQVASKLSAIAIIKRGLNLENIGDTFTLEEVEFEGIRYTIDQLVEVGLSRIYESQKPDGSFGYYPKTPSNLYVTMHVANTLMDLRDAGYEINENSLNRAGVALNNSVHTDRFRKNNDFAIISAYTVYKIGGRKGVNKEFKTRINKILNDEQLLNEKIGNVSLVYLALLLSDQPKEFSKRDKKNVYGILENKIDIDGRGAFMPLNTDNVIWRYYETPIKNTALLLKALVARGEDSEVMDRLMRWLLRSRSKDGAWGSTNNTLSVVASFTDYLIWKDENKSQFTLSISLNGEILQSYEYGPQNILTQSVLKKPISELPTETLNIINFSKENHNNLSNNYYYDMSLKYYLPIDKIPQRDEGFSIQRNFYSVDDEKGLESIKSAKVGDVLRGELKIIVHESRNFVAIEDFIPAGVELINFNLDTSDQSLQTIQDNNRRDYWYRDSIGARILRPDVVEMRDDRIFLFKERLPGGVYKFEYFVRVLVPGTFHHLPAVVSEMYFPENFGRTSGDYFEIN